MIDQYRAINIRRQRFLQQTRSRFISQSLQQRRKAFQFHDQALETVQDSQEFLQEVIANIKDQKQRLRSLIAQGKIKVGLSNYWPYVLLNLEICSSRTVIPVIIKIIILYQLTLRRHLKRQEKQAIQDGLTYLMFASDRMPVMLPLSVCLGLLSQCNSISLKASILAYENIRWQKQIVQSGRLAQYLKQAQEQLQELKEDQRWSQKIGGCVAEMKKDLSNQSQKIVLQVFRKLQLKMLQQFRDISKDIKKLLDLTHS